MIRSALDVLARYSGSRQPLLAPNDLTRVEQTSTILMYVHPASCTKRVEEPNNKNEVTSLLFLPLRSLSRDIPTPQVCRM